MELVFQEKQVQYLNRIVNETVLLEQTADLIVPDSLTDIDRVVDAFGTVIIRSQECSAQGVSADGMVQAGVLFVGSDDVVQRVSAQIPFSVRRDFAAAQENCTMQCKCTLRSVDARALNCRKLLVRVGIACTVTVYAQDSCKCYDFPETSANLQLKRVQLPLVMPLSVGEKSFAMNEELELPHGKPPVERLLKCVFLPQVDEEKIVGDKAVFKGKLLLHTLYEAADGELCCCDWTAGFSQYAQLMREMDDGELLTQLSLMSAEVEPDSQTDCRRLLLSANLLAQCTGFGEQKLCIAEDAFCTDAEFVPQFSPCDLPGILDRQTLSETATATSLEPAQSVLDSCIYPQELIRQRSEGKVHLELPLNCNVMYYDEQGRLQGKTLRTSICTEVALAEQGSCNLTNLACGSINASAGAQGLQLRVPIVLTLESSANHRINALCGGEITELQPSELRRSSVILRRMDNDEDIWVLAKAYRTPVQTILQANALQNECVAANTMLLIPT